MAPEPRTLTFLGTGDAASEACSAAVFEAEGQRLLIDCGPGTVGRYQQRYGELPRSVFVTHLHMDHVT
jgi:ribonuclease BN (tRNA processing enzyme)